MIICLNFQYLLCFRIDWVVIPTILFALFMLCLITVWCFNYFSVWALIVCVPFYWISVFCLFLSVFMCLSSGRCVAVMFVTSCDWLLFCVYSLPLSGCWCATCRGSNEQSPSKPWQRAATSPLRAASCRVEEREAVRRGHVDLNGNLHHSGPVASDAWERFERHQRALSAHREDTESEEGQHHGCPGRKGNTVTLQLSSLLTLLQ